MTYREYLKEKDLLPLMGLILKTFPMSIRERKLLVQSLNEEIEETLIKKEKEV